MRKLRCSSLPTFMSCPSSQQEPKTGKQIEESHELARVGDAVHAALACGVMWRPDDVNVESICEINHVKESDVWPLYKRGLKAFRTICAELLGEEPKEVGTEYAGSEEIGGEVLLTGTCDLVTQPIGLDWKSGYRIYEPKWQLNGYKRLHCFEVGVICWLRDDVIDVYRTGDDPKKHLLPAPEFDDALMAQVAKIGKEEVFGEHCFGCKRQHECESYAKHISLSASIVIDVNNLGTHPDFKGVLALRPQVSLLKKHIEMYERFVKAMIAQEGPMDIGDGKELAIVETERSKIDPSAAFQICMQYMNKDEFLGALKASKTDLVNIVKEKAERGQKAKVAHQFVKDLEAEGAVSKTQVQSVRVRRKINE